MVEQRQTVAWDEWDRAHDCKATCGGCGREVVVRTQKDDDPEYYTTVYVVCGCGSDVRFRLPVN